jgi:putative peptidoglycan lipid II flippase
VRALVADAALSSAFVPVFSELLEKGERARAWRVASTVFWLFLLIVGGLTALFVLAAPLLVPPLTGAYDDLTVTLAQILFPIVVLIGLFGIVTGILNSYDQFSIPALTPAFWNVAIIAGLVIGVPRADTTDGKLYVYAASIVVGTLIQFLLPLPWLRGKDGRLRLALDWRDPAVKQVFKLMGPVMLGLGLINVNAVIGTIVAANWVDGTIAPNAIDKAFRVYMLPQGMFSVAVATVLFPALSRLASHGDLPGLRALTGTGMRQIELLLIPSAAAIIALSEPMVRLVYQRGEFGASSTELVSEALFWFSFSLAFSGINLLLTRTFFALQEPWMPTRLALWSLVVNIVVALALYKPLGIGGIVIGTTVSNGVMMVLLATRLRRRLGGLEIARTLRATGVILAAGALLAGVTYGVWSVLDRALGESLIAQLVSVGLALALGAAAYIAAVIAAGVPEARQIADLIRRRLRR